MARRRFHAPKRRTHKAPSRRRSVSGLPAVQGVGAPRMPAVVTRVVRSGAAGAKKLAAKASNAATRANRLNKELNHEPQRTVFGALAGDAVGYGANKLITKIANAKDRDGKLSPDSFVNKHRTGTHLIVAGIAAAGAAGAAVTRHTQIMHGLAHLASFQLGSASAVEESKDKSYREVAGIDDDSFSIAGRADRVQRRRQIAQNLASQVRKEDPAATQGSDDLEGHCGELLESVALDVQGFDDALQGDTGVVPVAMLIPQLMKAMPMLQKMKSQQGQQEAAQEAAEGATPGIDTLLSLEGFQVDGMDVGSKRSLARQQRRLDRKQRRVERKQRKLEMKSLLKGDLVPVLDDLESRVSSLESDPTPVIYEPTAEDIAMVSGRYRDLVIGP